MEATGFQGQRDRNDREGNPSAKLPRRDSERRGRRNGMKQDQSNEDDHKA